MIIEIGTSDFRTQAGQVDGVFIEPVKYYFDRLQQLALDRLSETGGISAGHNTHFENVAISDYDGEGYMFYVREETIQKHNLPSWVRGCSSIRVPHPSAVSVLAPLGLIMSVRPVQVVRIKSIIDKYKITSLDLLKIDTEGHDCIILNDYINTVDILPKVIQFESNELSDPGEVAKVVERLKPLGYDCKQVKYDMLCTLM